MLAASGDGGEVESTATDMCMSLGCRVVRCCYGPVTILVKSGKMMPFSQQMLNRCGQIIRLVGTAVMVLFELLPSGIFTCLQSLCPCVSYLFNVTYTSTYE